MTLFRSLTISQHSIILLNLKKFHRTARSSVKGLMNGCFHLLLPGHKALFLMR